MSLLFIYGDLISFILQLSSHNLIHSKIARTHYFETAQFFCSPLKQPINQTVFIYSDCFG